MICYNEQDIKEPVKITEQEAIKRQKKVAKITGYVYKSDEEALEDFIVVHWTWKEQE